MEMIRSYHNLYLKCDVFLLGDMFDKFWKKKVMNYVQVIIWMHKDENGMQYN